MSFAGLDDGKAIFGNQKKFAALLTKRLTDHDTLVALSGQ
jgi:hypothetical protein